jgi:Arc/MetJ family transcription regulator
MSARTTTVEIDEAKLASVKEVLGTRTLRETVDRSFDEVLARAARERSIRRLQKMDGLDLDKPKVMKGAWR